MALISPVIYNSIVISYATTSGGSYTAFAAVDEIDYSGISATEINTTKLDDTAATSVPGRPDYGEVTMNIRYGPTIFNTLKGYIDAGTIIYIKVSPNDATTKSVFGPAAVWIKNLKPFAKGSGDKEVVAEVVFRLTSTVTFTAGT